MSGLDGATGAAFLDGDGEAVEWYSKDDPDRLRLKGAYLAVLVQAGRNSAKRLRMGALTGFIVDYEGALCLIEEIEGGYFFLLEMCSWANLAQARRRVLPVVDSLRQEIS